MAYNKDIDYAALIREQILKGASPEDVQSNLDARNAKIADNPELSQYANDDISQAATDYIAAKNNSGSPKAPAAAQTPQTPTYSSPYGGSIDTLLSQIMGQGDFSYDYTKDPTYNQYKESYTREGNRAMEDTLGQVSARTGGLASSYAVSAAAGANNEYMQKLGDVIPELEQAAYGRYQDKQNNRYNQLNALSGLESAAYGKYRDTVGDSRYATEWQHQLDREGVEDSRYASEWQNTLDRQGVEDSRYDQQYADSRTDTEFSKASTLLNMGFSSEQVAQTLGISPEQAQAYADRVVYSQTPHSSGSGNSSPDYTLDQLANYQGLREHLFSGKKTAAEIMQAIQKAGEDTYINMVGEDLYQALLDEAMGYQKPETTVDQDALLQEERDTLYNQMMASGDPWAWLDENSWIGPEDVKYFKSILGTRPKSDGYNSEL